MKWLLVVIVALQMLLPESVQAASFPVAEPADPTAADIHSESAILIDMNSGDVLFSKNSDKMQYPASITKIVTGILAIENGHLNDIVTVSKNARDVEGTRIYLAEGEQKPMIDLLYGMLMNSGNDAAIAIAEHMDGSVEAFSRRMNDFVKKIGATHTHFVNPDGLYDKQHYTTAADMAKIAAYAMQNPIFSRIVATKEKPWNGTEWKSKLENHNKLLTTYSGANGVKNGFTTQAKFTLVESAKRNGMDLIAVLMKADTDREINQDAERLLDFGFAHFKSVRILGERQQLSSRGERYTVNKNLFATIPKNDQFRVNTGDPHHIIVQTTSGKIQAYSPVLTQREIPDTGHKDYMGSAEDSSSLYYWTAVSAGVLIAGWLSLRYRGRRA
ncbi:D-alanyl-D-alanine carboxypeptidase [Aneurinibacillus sp. Ricciae_BoGa-3]|uniref:D-alanyl-D-alanine carboxypeptidase family protein n=1 Tax=Aneurinibacillus sp. Ricciae_BoGa-3 TaxID=3022697 RepID=UPI002342182A|nr:D-alanyl-D-alanine carboxypeptidase family protein [Aneurinibacillus sp. Ricciae_BoGa-3]WCK55738.1 D-alanyl-D-alanine carboxypeptidase [Aneurinibacillus sp. Ricciae_BoGa-3]